MYKNILIPTDGSELAGKAVQLGMNFAKAIGAKITVLTVLTPFPVFTADSQAVEDTEPEYKARMTESRTKLLAAISDATKAAGVRCETVRVYHEHPYEAIIETANSKGCDLPWLVDAIALLLTCLRQSC